VFAVALAIQVLASVSIAAAQPARTSEEAEPFRSPELAALQSLVLPGWGQHYIQEPKKGWGFMGVAAAGLLIALDVVGAPFLEDDHEEGLGWMLYGLSTAWSVIDAYTGADRLNRENGYDIGGVPRPDAQTRVTLVSLRF
jgi:hypothetical protein